MYVCRKMRLCSYLLSKGFEYIEKRKDKFNKKYDVWIFKSTPELFKTIEEYYEINKDFCNKKIQSHSIL